MLKDHLLVLSQSQSKEKQKAESIPPDSIETLKGIKWPRV